MRSCSGHSVLGVEVDNAVKEERIAWEAGGRREESMDVRSVDSSAVVEIAEREEIGGGLRRDVKASRSVLRLGGASED